MKRVAAFIAFGAIAAACTIWNDAGLPEFPEPGNTSSSSSSSSSGDGGGCERATIDKKGPAEGAGGDIDFVIAVRAISLGLVDGKTNPEFGYDLDGVCSASCTPRGDADAGVPEGKLGRDNGTARAVEGLAGIQDPASYANESFVTGGIGILARVRGYNGQPNDTEIRFSLYRATGVENGKPDFDNPDQEWKVDSTDVKLNVDDYTSLTEQTGFIRDGKLVVEFGSSRIPFNTDSDILLNEVTFTGEVVQEANGRWNVKNAIGVGRWGLLDALQTIARVKDPTKPKNDDTARLCKNPVILGAARQLICQSADIMQASKDDSGGKKCNALSAAVGFDAVPAKFGPLETPTRVDACAGFPVQDCD